MATREQQRSPSDASDVLRSVALSLKAHASDHAAAIAHCIHGRMPEFGSDARVTQQTVDAITAIITGFARMVLRAEAPEDVVVPAEALEYSRTFARRGIDYSLLVRIYRLGHEELRRVCESTLAEQALGPEALGPARDELSTALFDYDDIVSGRVLEEYDAERARWAPSPDKLRHETVAAILAMEPVEADRASRALRYRLDVIHVAFVLWVVDATEGLGPEDRMHAAARDLVTGTACAASLVVPAGKLVTWGWLGFREHPDEQQMAALLSSGRRTDGVSVAVGEPAPGIDGFRRSHGDASSARRLASLSHTRPGAATRWGNVAALGLLSADPEHARQFVTRELGPLDADDDAMARLRATLATYFLEGDVISATAQRLGIHINTVSYRLRQCEDLLERPVKRRRFELEAALLLRDRLGMSLALPHAD